MKTFQIKRNAVIPDPIRINRYKKIPELGPKVLFFSGGTALNALSSKLKNYTYNSIHLVTPFDSGGSSAKLRQSFEMPAIGDLRSRMVALADETITGHPEVYRLFTYRLSKTKSQKQLRIQVAEMAANKDPLIKDIPNPMRRLIRNLLGYFLAQLPNDFDLKGASIGNLVLTGGYLNNHRHLDPIIFLFSKLVSVQGTVRAIVNENLHLAAKLESGEIVLGQHNMTGKETPPIQSRITELVLSKNKNKLQPTNTKIRKKIRKLIQQADLIVYPPGSFFSSLIANLIPDGVSEAIAENENPKVFIPNLGNDPEQYNMEISDTLETLLTTLQPGLSGNSSAKGIDFILMDSSNGRYHGALPKNLEKKGIQVIDTKLISPESKPYYDPALLTNVLLSLT